LLRQVAALPFHELQAPWQATVIQALAPGSEASSDQQARVTPGKPALSISVPNQDWSALCACDGMDHQANEKAAGETSGGPQPHGKCVFSTERERLG